MTANRSTMMTTPTGTAIAMISVSEERGSLMGGGMEEEVGEDVGKGVGEEEDEVVEAGVRQVGLLGSN